MTTAPVAGVWMAVVVIPPPSLQMLLEEDRCRPPVAAEQTCAYSTLSFLVQVCWWALGSILLWLRTVVLVLGRVQASRWGKKDKMTHCRFPRECLLWKQVRWCRQVLAYLLLTPVVTS